MIENDEQFKKVLKEYMKGKGIEATYPYNLCEGLECKDCILSNAGVESKYVGSRASHVCSQNPFESIKQREDDIRHLKQEIKIMEMWEAETESDLVRELRDICNTLKSRAKEPKCPTDVCEKCPFYNINSFSFWLIYTRNQMNRKRNAK